MRSAGLPKHEETPLTVSQIREHREGSRQKRRRCSAPGDKLPQDILPASFDDQPPPYSASRLEASVNLSTTTQQPIPHPESKTEFGQGQVSTRSASSNVWLNSNAGCHVHGGTRSITDPREGAATGQCDATAKLHEVHALMQQASQLQDSNRHLKSEIARLNQRRAQTNGALANMIKRRGDLERGIQNAKRSLEEDEKLSQVYTDELERNNQELERVIQMSSQASGYSIVDE